SGTPDCSSAPLLRRLDRGRVRSRLAGLIGQQNTITDGVAHRVEEAPAAVHMPPTLEVDALRIGPHVEKIGPLLIVESGRITRTRDMRLAAIAELDFGPRFTATGTRDQQHWKSLSAQQPQPRPRRSTGRCGSGRA